MADYDAGLVADIFLGEDLGGELEPPPPMNAGVITGLVGEQGGGAEVFRDIPPLIRDIP